MSKSSVSRRFVALTSAQLTTWLARPLADLDVRIVFLDGPHFRDHVVLLALGVDAQGQKHVLALREGTTENATVCRGLLTDLRARGLDLERAVLFVIDGGRGLRKAIRETCGLTAVVQRCQVHKRRNVLEHLPKAMRPRVRRVLAEAYELADAALAKRRLLQLAAGLDHTHPGAAASLREGLDETLTLQRLGVTGTLYRTPRSTNGIENLNGLIGHFITMCAAGATAACSSAGSLPACRRLLAASAGCAVTVISLPSSARSTARPWTAGRRSHRNRHPSRRSPAFNSERDIPSALGHGDTDVVSHATPHGVPARTPGSAPALTGRRTRRART